MLFFTSFLDRNGHVQFQRPETRRLHVSPYNKSSSVRHLTVIPLFQLIRSTRYVSYRTLALLFPNRRFILFSSLLIRIAEG
jgi:hypothetical protein